ncbi:hypothetical protein ACEPAH_4139 [Sanghuangporus vaninii]
MQSIHQAAEKLAENWRINERERGILFSMLDDSDDENPSVKKAEHRRAALEKEIQKVLRTRNRVVKVLQRIPRLPNDSALLRRSGIAGDVAELTKTYTGTSLYRANEAKNSTVVKYAFNIEARSKNGESSSSVRGSDPSFIWKLCFRKLRLSTVKSRGEQPVVSRDTWKELGYDEKGFEKWWRPKRLVSSSESDGWSDMKRLARRVVIQILERIQSSAFENFHHIRHLKILAEICREIVLYQIILCYNVPLDDIVDLQDLFEHTVPVIYLVCDVVYGASDISAADIPEVYRVEKQLQRLDPLVREVRNRCYLLGARIGFDVEAYREDFSKGRIFDFDQDPDNKSAFIQLNPLIAGKSHDEYMKRVGSIAQKQVVVRENVYGTSHARGTGGSEAEAKVDLLDKKALESIGLKQFTDIRQETEVFLGSGGFAEVCRMERDKGSRPVAVKKYKPKPRTAKRIEREARAWATVKHKHIAPLLGFVCFTSGWATQPCLVSEPYHCDLKRLVYKYRDRQEIEGQALTEDQKLAFLRDIVLALEFLHASGIAHGDLRAANVLITNEMFQDPSCYAVLNDFGMAEQYVDDIDSLLDHRDLSSVNQCTSDLWLSPELLEAAPRESSLSRVSKEGDIYAFGVVFLEVVYERDPYAETKYNIRYAKSIGEPPARKEDLHLLSESHWTLMQGCWEALDKRLNIKTVAWAVLDILDQLLPPTPTGPEDPGMAYWSRYLKKEDA